MPNESGTKPKPRRTTTVPVTTVEELPVLTDAEHAELLASLQEAKRDIEAGRGVDYDSKTFKDRLVRIYRRAKLG